MDLLPAIADLADAITATTEADERRRWGQFFTGVDVAGYMGRLFGPPRGGPGAVRLLDPGAGVGILGIAAARSLLDGGSRPVHLVAVENEPRAASQLVQALTRARHSLGDRFSFEVVEADFLEMAQPSMGTRTLERFDAVVSNPPYFKMSPSEWRGGVAPNIYARFMEIAAHLLRAGGQMVFIVPRSFASGVYFKRFRTDFHARMCLEHVHVFDSRRQAFKNQGVLQENIIVKYRKGSAHSSTVSVSSSMGVHDLGSVSDHQVSRSLLLPAGDPLGVLHLPTSAADIDVLDTFGGWCDNLRTYRLDVSTGPVVPFRSRDHLVARPNGEAVVPLLWMQHIRPDGVTWPIGGRFRKQEYIRASAPDKLLVPNRTYVLLRRFSAKEEERRLTASVLSGGVLPGVMLGLENHLNFVHRPGGHLEADEAVGLAALLNSSLFDRYFRIVNGNTQVNATEIRALPLPPRSQTLMIGRRLSQDRDRPVEPIIHEVLRVEAGAGKSDPRRARNASETAERERRVHAPRDGRGEAEDALG